MVIAADDKAFGNRLLNRCKERSWSQPGLGRQVNTSGTIIGRYEGGDIISSIEVTKKPAEALESSTRDRIVSLVDNMVRETKARQAYWMNV